MKRTTWLLALTLGTLACNQQQQEQPTAQVEAEKPNLEAAAVPTALTDEAVDQLALPVKEDFEDEAFSAIDEDTLESRIDALEKEIAADVE
jgi:hypothetical protein